MWKNLHIPTDFGAFITQLRPTNPRVGADSTRSLYILSQKESTCTFVFIKAILWEAGGKATNICYEKPGLLVETFAMDRYSHPWWQLGPQGQGAQPWAWILQGEWGKGTGRRSRGAQNSQGLKLPKIPKLGCRKHQNSQRRPLLMGTGNREREYLGKFHWQIILFSGMSPRVSEDFIILISEILKIMERRCLLKPIALHFLAGFDLKHSKHIQQPLLPWRQRL